MSIVKRLQTTHKGVIGVVVARADGAIVHTTMSELDSAKIIDMATKINVSVTDAVKESRYDPQASKSKERQRIPGNTPLSQVEVPVRLQTHVQA